MKIILAIVLSIPVLFILIGKLLSTKRYKGPVTEHFNGKKFINPNRLEAQNLRGVSKYMRERSPEPWNKNYETFVRSNPVTGIDKTNKVHTIFVNHSTFLIQFAGKNILTDPIWSKRCSPFQFAGPARMRPPGIRFEDLPDIDIVTISHNHYDHLDKNTIKALNKSHNPHYIVPLGVGSYMKKLGCKKITELDWFGKTDLDDNPNIPLKIHAMPANHFSSRGIFDRDTSLWCGFLFETPDYKLYYIGDTGYGNHFKDIGSSYGPIDLALIPIGAYKPEWFMGPIHISPAQALMVHDDIRSKQSIAMHFGTFPLADDGQGVAQADLKLAMEARNFDPERFIIPEEGKSYSF